MGEILEACFWYELLEAQVCPPWTIDVEMDFLMSDYPRRWWRGYITRG